VFLYRWEGEGKGGLRPMEVKGERLKAEAKVKGEGKEGGQ
jgi:hypothetical protein